MRLIKKQDNIFLYEIQYGTFILQTLGYKVITPWGTFFTFDYQEALNQFNNWVDDLK